MPPSEAPPPPKNLFDTSLSVEHQYEWCSEEWLSSPRLLFSITRSTGLQVIQIRAEHLASKSGLPPKTSDLLHTALQPRPLRAASLQCPHKHRAASQTSWSLSLVISVGLFSPDPRSEQGAQLRSRSAQYLDRV